MHQWQERLDVCKQASPRREQNLNGRWQFRCETDVAWTTLRVPGCYTDARESKWRKDYWDAYGHPRHWAGKGGVYRRSVTLSAEQLARPLALRCEGCYHVYRVLLNGHEVGQSEDGYTPLVCRLNAAARPGDNTLEVVVSADRGRLSGGESSASRGIWQDVSLLSHHPLFIAGNPLIDARVAAGCLACNVPLRNDGGEDASFRIAAVATDPAGIVQWARQSAPQSLAPGASDSVAVEGAWEEARRWFPHDPYLYTIHVLVLDEHDAVLDHWQDRFGFREITWNGPHLYLNGQELYLRGHGGHYLGDLQGTKEYFTTWFRAFKKRGINFLRLHIYPKHKVLYEAADEVGIMLMGEPAFHFVVPEETETDRAFAMAHLGGMIDHLRNHPSIIMWSVSNELRWQGGGEKPWLVDHARRKDSTRPAFSSDFTAFSTYGDLAGHHYSTDEVFDEWREYAPDKPMIWDECGSVWQETRPLHNGTAGCEVASQDYATGIFRDGNDEILHAFNVIREGRTFGGGHHRVNAVIPWDLGYVFFRWQPYNRFCGIALAHADPTARSMQPTQVLPCCSPLNIWDPTLPVYEPNPGFYLFEEDLKWVRFPGESRSRSFFAGDRVTVTSPLCFYEDLRPADAVRCRVETEDGRLLTECEQPVALEPGGMYRDMDWTFQMPEVDAATPVTLVREFIAAGHPGHRDERPAMMYPRLENSQWRADAQLAVHDPGGALSTFLDQAGIKFRAVDQPANAGAGTDVLITTGVAVAADLTERIEAGLRVIQLLPAEADYVGAGSAVKLLNGPVYRCLAGLRQEEFTFWRGGSLHGTMVRPAGAVNHRVVLAADRDGATSALHEEYLGAGLRITTSLRIAASLESEPAAQWMLRNLITEAVDYVPAPAARRVAVFGSQAWRAFVNQTGVVATALDELSAAALASVDVLLVEAASAVGAAAVLAAFAEAGGRVFVQELTPEAVDTFSHACGRPLELTEPYLGERHHCVKAATSWTLRKTPKDGVEYYEQIVIPQPFEPNYDPLLAGIANIDLQGTGEALFARGVKPKGFNPVGLTEDVRMLISNWRIDWSVPPAGGEYTNLGKDIRRANWFLNRDPVLLRVAHGTGMFLFCQIDLPQVDEGGLRLMRQLLTNLECSLGRPTHMPENVILFDPLPEEVQRERLAAVEKQLAALPPLPELPEIYRETARTRGTGGGDKPRILLVMDCPMEAVRGEVIKEIGDFADTTIAHVQFDTVEELPERLKSAIGSTTYDIIYFTLGNAPATDAAGQAAMQRVLDTLKRTRAQLMWGTTPPRPAALAGDGYNEGIDRFNRQAKQLMIDNNVYINDCHGFYTQQLLAYLDGDSLKLDPDSRKKLVCAIAKAIKFFGC